MMGVASRAAIPRRRCASCLTRPVSLALSLVMCAVAAVAAPGRPPNIVFLLLDDMGYADVGAYGNTYHRTPNIDRLAREGVRFSDAYAAAPNCSPTRASILTGRWPARIGLTQYLPGNVLPHARKLQAELPLGLPLDESVIAEPLAAAGYATACVGKWHLGGGVYAPQQRGFETSFAWSHWGSHRSMFAPHPRLDVPGTTQGDYLTDKLTEAAEGFIERNRDRPFFVYLAYYSVHSPIQAKPMLVDSYAGRPDPTGRHNSTYAAMVEGVDISVGRILGTLAELGLDENTVVFFFSDNGGVSSRAFNGGFRSGKGYLWEGGIREPLIVRWPGVARRGSVESTPVSSVDFYPTILDIAGIDDAAGHTSDGANLVPLLRGTGSLDRKALFWHYPHYSNSGSKPAGAIRKGRWKLLEFYEDSRTELYDLAADAAESNDLSGEMSARAASMRSELEEWRRSVNAVMPEDNPAFDAERARQRYGVVYKDGWNPDDPFRPRP